MKIRTIPIAVKTTYFTFDPNVTKEERSFRVELMDGPAMGNYYVIQRAY